MKKRHDEGFFVATLNAEPGAYRIEIEKFDGGKTLIEDPYRFAPIMSEFDLHLHSEGTLYEAWRSYGAHVAEFDGVTGVRFAVWAPNALCVSLTGDFNDWDPKRHPMRARSTGVWEIFLPGAKEGDAYKYNVRSKHVGHEQLKADPYGFARRPRRNRRRWSAMWKAMRGTMRNGCGLALDAIWLKEPVSIYEVHLESWMRHPDGERSLIANWRQASSDTCSAWAIRTSS